MKKFILSLFTFTLALLVIACGAQPELPISQTENDSRVSGGNTLAAIREKGEIIIGLDDTFPPMEYRNDKNELVGYDIDFAKAIGKELGVEVKYVPSAWDGILPGLGAKRFDIILSSMSVTDERKKQVDFVEYFGAGQIVAVKAGNPLGIRSVEDLKGKVVGVQLGSTGEAAADSIEDIKEVKKYNTNTDVFNDMALGRLDAAVIGEMVGRYYMTTKPGVFEVVGESFQIQPMGIAVRKDDVELREELEKAVQTLKDNGTLSEISQKWFKADITKN
ncbi:amino acid ABC transporter substrate-binding protein [Neobacillus notoginsengisoli]|uniref:Amino acid ABC transporter substrate-binding protein n=1 Tax=Neobacillus notoginsengisoli TaxID=1578198 RepID=A0A417YN33_9BACI|nr:amino acid ABC transporter substrate-binding protein [Neobacillus notoginsengisoli]RHW34820.1 amino acid ABC transporter substrate-binding protein [Neobacillus notoginsengisoli]